jgi:hypothetical protein
VILRRLLALFIVLLGVLGASPAAMAEPEVTETAPQDAPMILEAASVTIPPLLGDMTTRDHDWLKLSYPASIDSRIGALVEDADVFKAELGAYVGQTVLEHVEVRIVRSQEDMNTLAPVGFPPPRYAIGVAYSALHLVIISLRDPKTAEAVDLAEVMRHELVHVGLFDATQGHHVPRWFNEGLAVNLSGEDHLTRLRTLWDATLSKTLIPLADLDKSFPDENMKVSIAYAESADFVRFLLRDEDRARFGSLIERVRKGAAFDRALSDAYSDSTRKLEYQWHEELEKRFSFWPVLTGSSMLWAIIMGMLVVAWMRRRKKAKETLARWAKEEAEEDARRAAVVEAAAEVPFTGVARRSIPTIQHDGEWHTLH